MIILIGYLVPSNIISPVALNEISKVDPESFWYYPWGESGVHKGIDMFCEKNTSIVAPVSGIIIGKGYGTVSGNYLYLLGPKWRTYYFAHLNSINVGLGSYVSRGDEVGKAGNTGNAASRPCHLHFAIETIFPYIWLNDTEDIEGWKKIFYLNPLKELRLNTQK